jgi:hypothetical protein
MARNFDLQAGSRGEDRLSRRDSTCGRIVPGPAALQGLCSCKRGQNEGCRKQKENAMAASGEVH